MNQFLRKLLNYDTVDALIAIGYGHMEAIAQKDMEIKRLQLEKMRWGRDMVAQFLTAWDKPEEADELRERLHAALSDLSDEVARMEEHSGV